MDRGKAHAHLRVLMTKIKIASDKSNLKKHTHSLRSAASEQSFPNKSDSANEHEKKKKQAVDGGQTAGGNHRILYADHCGN